MRTLMGCCTLRRCVVIAVLKRDYGGLLLALRSVQDVVSRALQYRNDATLLGVVGLALRYKAVWRVLRASTNLGNQPVASAAAASLSLAWLIHSIFLPRVSGWLVAAVSAQRAAVNVQVQQA